MRQEAGLGVSRFCELVGIPRATWYRRARRAAEGRPGAWPVAGSGPRPCTTAFVVELPGGRLARGDTLSYARAILRLARRLYRGGARRLRSIRAGSRTCIRERGSR